MQKTTIAIWFIMVSVPLSYLMGMHSLSLNPSHNKNLRKLANIETRWSKLHFLGADCNCSEKVFSELTKRAPDKNNDERVFIIGKNSTWEKTLKLKGYEVVIADMDEYEKKYSIKAVPQLIILNAQKTLVYGGGYSGKRNPSSIDDEFILNSLKGNKSANERPIFGCVNGSINRKNSDPLKLKY